MVGIIGGGILLFLGLLFLVVGGSGLVTTGFDFAAPETIVLTIFSGVGLLLAAGGGLWVILAIIAGRRNRAKAMMIYERGIQTKGTVTFVDRNFSVLINNRPIYSIVEFTFTDMSGVEHVSRKPNTDSELVIRNQVEVGSQIDIKYLAEDPSQNIIMLPDPSAT